MRRHWTLGAALAATLVAGLLAAPAPAASRDDDKQFDIERREYVADTKHGQIFVHVAHAVDDGKIVRAPSIFTYSPYSILGTPPNYRRANDAERWVPDGYHRVWADVVGTGNSGGCFDYGGKREKETGAALVEWITKQKWSNGKVAMMGGSYEGTTATAAAVENPKGLVTIVPEAAISRWYEYAYSGGVRYFLNDEAIGNQGPGSIADEGFDTPLAFDFGLALPPPLDAGGPGWAQRVQSAMTPCDEIEHTEHGYDDTPDYDKFWLERDYIVDAKKIDIPVLIAHNWGDWNVKQEEAFNLYHALKNSPKRVLYMGTRWQGHSTPGGGYDKFVEKWMAHYLKGVNNGIDKSPTVISQVANQDAAGKWYKGRPPRTRNISLIAQATPRTSAADYQWKILPSKPLPNPFGGAEAASFPGVSTQELHANGHPRNNHEWLWFESPPLKKDVRIFGTPKVQIYSTVQREWVTYTPLIVDVDPAKMIMVEGNHVGYTDSGAHLSVTRGFHDSRYRNSLAKQAPVEPGRPFEMTIAAKPVDYIFKKGHFIGLNFMTDVSEWTVAKPYPCDSNACALVNLNLDEGRTRLILPVVNGPKNAHTLFQAGGHAHG
ncbi:MAG: CocE/NonD family hydrolase [Actinomycetota bacterium]